MRVLITGAGGFIGKHLALALRHRGEQVLEWNRDTAPELQKEYCREAEFVFHLAGVNCPRNPEEFHEGNASFTAHVLRTLKTCGSRCPVMLASSTHAALTGRSSGSAYGKSKLAAEELAFSYGADTGAQVLVYRLPNVFGKWCRPNYNSAVATFCHNIARNLPITVHNPATELELLYIDDLIGELLLALDGKPHRSGRYCVAPVTHRATLGRIVELLQGFHAQQKCPLLPKLPEDAFERKLYAAYLSCLPPEAARFPLETHRDSRGSFTELARHAGGQLSINVTNPGEVRGRHWHHSKWEIFVAVSGRGVIRQRHLISGETMAFPVSGETPSAVRILPGYVHEIENTGGSEAMVTVIWASEPYDPGHPDTYQEGAAT